MSRQRILAGLLMPSIVCGVILGMNNGIEIKAEETEKDYVPSIEYCRMEELGEMDYYLFCDTQLHKGALDGMGGSSIDYKEEFLREDVALISLSFSNGIYHNNNDVGINVMVNLSESDKARMKKH